MELHIDCVFSRIQAGTLIPSGILLRDVQGQGIELSWWRACLVCRKPWVRFTALHEPRGSEVQGYPSVHSKFKAILRYTRPKKVG